MTKTYDHVLNIKVLNLFLHYLKEKVSNWRIQWVRSFLKEQKLSLILERKTNVINIINTEISQKFFVLSISYIFSIANLLKIYKQSERKTIFIEFVNNVNVLTYSSTVQTRKKTAKH